MMYQVGFLIHKNPEFKNKYFLIGIFNSLGATWYRIKTRDTNNPTGCIIETIRDYDYQEMIENFYSIEETRKMKLTQIKKKNEFRLVR